MIFFDKIKRWYNADGCQCKFCNKELNAISYRFHKWCNRDKVSGYVRELINEIQATDKELNDSQLDNEIMKVKLKEKDKLIKELRIKRNEMIQK